MVLLTRVCTRQKICSYNFEPKEEKMLKDIFNRNNEDERLFAFYVSDTLA